MNNSDKVGVIGLVIVLIIFSIVMYFSGYKDGQTDAIKGKWKFETDTTYIKVKKIK